jgi:hypothetical protein
MVSSIDIFLIGPEIRQTGTHCLLLSVSDRVVKFQARVCLVSSPICGEVDMDQTKGEGGEGASEEEKRDETRSGGPLLPLRNKG